MKTLALLVLAVVGLVVSSAFAGEVLMINQETGEVQVEKSSPLRPANAFQQEAYKNPGTEVPVWSRSSLQFSNFFWGQIVKTATNVVIYRDEKIQSLTKEVKEGGEIFFLWYKIFLILAELAMIVSNILFKRGNTASASAFAAAAAVASAVASAVAVAVAVAAASAVTVAAASAFAFGAADDRLKYWILSGIFYVMAGLAIFV